MSAQMAIDFHSARDVGIDRARRANDRKNPDWSETAFLFLCRYAYKFSLFTPEEVTEAAEQWGIAPPTDRRAWGAVYLRAVREKIIKRSNVTYQRRFGHASIGIKWQSLNGPV